MKKFVMFLGVLFVGAISTSFTTEVTGWYPGVRIFFDWDGDGYHCRTSIANTPWSYNSALSHGYYKTTTLGKETAQMDRHACVHP